MVKRQILARAGGSAKLSDLRPCAAPEGLAGVGQSAGQAGRLGDWAILASWKHCDGEMVHELIRVLDGNVSDIARACGVDRSSAIASSKSARRFATIAVPGFSRLEAVAGN